MYSGETTVSASSTVPVSEAFSSASGSTEPGAVTLEFSAGSDAVSAANAGPEKQKSALDRAAARSVFFI